MTKSIKETIHPYSIFVYPTGNISKLGNVELKLECLCYT